MDWENQLEKNMIKNRKTVKTRVKLPRVNKKPRARKQIFVQSLFSHSTLKIHAAKPFGGKIHAAKPFAFSLHFLFRRDQNHHSNLTSKIMKMCEQIFQKKRKRPNTIQILWIVKNHDIPNNSSHRFAAIINNTNKQLKHFFAKTSTTKILYIMMQPCENQWTKQKKGGKNENLAKSTNFKNI